MRRAVNFSIAIILSVLLLPVFAIIALLVLIKLGRPVFFRQTRPGLHGKLFQMIKFRTMSNKKSPDGRLLSDEQRLTVAGKFMRATSLDELPELWNVIKGDMNIVGPRPLLMEYLPLYTAEQARRHSVKPGITGWAQVNGRNAITWAEKLNLDIWYVDNRSFSLDIKILWMTIIKVFTRQGINQEGQSTMEKFKGNGHSYE